MSQPAVPAPALVTLHVWGIPTRRVPLALLHTAGAHFGVRRIPGLRFAKVLGTGRGRSFTALDADPRRWAVLATWRTAAEAAAFERSAVVRRFDDAAEERWRAELGPLSSRGRWSRQAPFGDPVPLSHSGPVAALTRARLTPRKAVRFWRAVPPVSADLRGHPGLRLAIGIGELPVLFQGTFSIWSSAAALADFAYRRGPHRQVVRRTPTEGWYAEELFTRFAVLDAAGTVHGRDPLR